MEKLWEEENQVLIQAVAPPMSIRGIAIELFAKNSDINLK